MPMKSRFWCCRLSVGTKPVFGATGLGTAQSWFWSRHKAGFVVVGLESAQSWLWSRHKAGFGAVGLGSAQSRYWNRHKTGLGGAGYKTGFVSRQVLHLLSKICHKTGQYKTCIVRLTRCKAQIYMYICMYIVPCVLEVSFARLKRWQRNYNRLKQCQISETRAIITRQRMSETGRIVVKKYDVIVI